MKETYTAYALTTYDNPYDPLDEFDKWFSFDNEQGYGTISYLSRIAHTSDELSDEQNRLEISRAIDEILHYDFEGVYRKITREITEEVITA